MEKQGKSGKVKGLFIPYEVNKLFVSEKTGAVYLDIVAFKLKEPQEHSTHIVKQSFSKDERDKMTEEEQKNKPILGNLNVKEGNFTEANNNAAPGKTFTEKDDLPF